MKQRESQVSDVGLGLIACAVVIAACALLDAIAEYWDGND